MWERPTQPHQRTSRCPSRSGRATSKPAPIRASTDQTYGLVLPGSAIDHRACREPHPRLEAVGPDAGGPGSAMPVPCESTSAGPHLTARRSVTAPSRSTGGLVASDTSSALEVSPERRSAATSRRRPRAQCPTCTKPVRRGPGRRQETCGIPPSASADTTGGVHGRDARAPAISSRTSSAARPGRRTPDRRRPGAASRPCPARRRSARPTDHSSPTPEITSSPGVRPSRRPVPTIVTALVADHLCGFGGESSPLAECRPHR